MSIVLFCMPGYPALCLFDMRHVLGVNITVLVNSDLLSRIVLYFACHVLFRHLWGLFFLTDILLVDSVLSD